jgi:hypothetical protein
MATSTTTFHTFEGTSNNGDLTEALAAAIAHAEVELSQDFLNWELVKLRGQHGGIVGANRLTVVIRSTGSQQLSGGVPSSKSRGKATTAAIALAAPARTAGGLEKFAQTTSLNPVFLDTEGGVVELDLTVSTYCEWQFEMLHIDESGESGGAQRHTMVGEPGQLVGKSATWRLRITNISEEEQDYHVVIQMKQSGADASVYEFEKEGKIDPSKDRDAKMGQTLTFFAA